MFLAQDLSWGCSKSVALTGAGKSSNLTHMVVVQSLGPPTQASLQSCYSKAAQFPERVSSKEGREIEIERGRARDQEIKMETMVSDITPSQKMTYDHFCHSQLVTHTNPSTTWGITQRCEYQEAPGMTRTILETSDYTCLLILSFVILLLYLTWVNFIHLNIIRIFSFVSLHKF